MKRPITRPRHLALVVIASALVGGASMFTGLALQAPPQPRPAATPAVLQNYPPVTAARLTKPADNEWLMIRRTYDGWGYSPLDQISPANVTRLQPEWIFSTGLTSGHQAAPIVNGGVMFISTPGNQVFAIDAVSGQQLWRYRRPEPSGLVRAHNTSRGVPSATVLPRQRRCRRAR
jgi:alcohol dehydrogenase (cytochrome c)